MWNIFSIKMYYEWSTIKSGKSLDMNINKLTTTEKIIEWYKIASAEMT